MKAARMKLSMDRPEYYQIKVPGEFGESWVAWAGEIEFTVACERDGYPVTIMTGVVDQAGLHGMLRRLYSLGVPILSVTWLGGLGAMAITGTANNQP